MIRPVLRPAFLDAEHRPQVTFFTSSNDKFLQARLVFGRFGLPLRYSRHADRPYNEDYAGSGEQLLNKAVKEIVNRGGSNGSFFFIEDTTIRIEALSTSTEDVPGLRAKEWFKETSFGQLDCELRRHQDRTASVRSTIALYVPGVSHLSFFYGRMNGVVAGTPPNFLHNPQYPWLTPNNFNGWLIPNGAAQRLGEMSFELSWDYDFRVKAFINLVERLEEYTVAANARATLFRRRRMRTRTIQPGLFEIKVPIFIVVGPTCAGKTTFGDHAESQDFRVIDASSIVRMIAEERTGSATDATVYAKQLLESEGADIVARRVASLIAEEDIENHGMVITGFRTIEEIEFIRSAFPRAVVVSLESGQRPRYERYLRRKTRKQLENFKQFQARDVEQFSLGLLEVACELADVRISNDGTLEEFAHQVEFVLKRFGRKDGEPISGPTSTAPGVSRVTPPKELHRSQLYRCLMILRDAGRPLTTQEIEARFSAGDGIRYNNANKMLKRYPAMANRLESPDTNVRYKITPAGLAFLRAIQDRARDGS